MHSGVPPSLEAWLVFSVHLPSLSAQSGATWPCPLPQTGFSATASLGTKERVTQSYSAPGAVMCSSRSSSSRTSAWSVSADLTSASLQLADDVARHPRGCLWRAHLRRHGHELQLIGGEVVFVHITALFADQLDAQRVEDKAALPRFDKRRPWQAWRGRRDLSLCPA